MNTFIYIGKPPGTGTRFPERGVDCWFRVNQPKPEFFRKGVGYKRFKAKDWMQEEIPDLAKPFTREQWIAYADQYGDMCATEFLDTCDYMKSTEAYRMRHPPKYEAEWRDPENRRWFKNMFRRDLFDFLDGFRLGLGNTYALDVIRFEKHLASEFGYPMHEYGSMSDFMKKTFGDAATDRFCRLAFPSKYEKATTP